MTERLLPPAAGLAAGAVAWLLAASALAQEPPPGGPPPGDLPAAPAGEPPPPPPPPLSLPPNDEVRIQADRTAKAPGSAHMVKKEQLDRFKYDDPQQVLLGVPGVYARGEDGVGLRPNLSIRGAVSDRSKKLTLMEDGVLFGPAPYSAPAAYYFPLITRMRGVRVVKGPGAIGYGPQTVGGAIDLLTREIPSSRQGMLDVAAGQYGYHKMHLVYGSSDERAGFLIEGVRLGNSGFKSIDGIDGADTGSVRNEWMAKASYALDPESPIHQEISLKLGYYDEVSNETYLGLTDADFRASPYRRYLASRDDQMRSNRTQIEASHRAVFPGGFEAQTTAYRHVLHRVWRRFQGLGGGADVGQVLANPGSPRNALLLGVLAGRADSIGDDDTLRIGPNDRAFVAQGVQTVLRLRGRTGPVKHQVEYGLRLHYDEIQRHHTEDGFRVAGGKLVADGQPTEVTADNEASTYATAFHLTDQISWKRLSISPGARLELIQSRTRDRLSGLQGGDAYAALAPGVGVYAGLTDELGLLGGVHRGISPKAPEASPGTKLESSVNYEAGARYASKNARAEVIGFFNDYTNLTDVCTASNGCLASNLDRQFDAGAVFVYGAEVYAEGTWKLPGGLRAPMRAAYTLTLTRVRNNFEASSELFGGQAREGDELPYIPRHQASGSAGVEGKRWGVNVGGTYVGAMRERVGQGEAAESELTDAYFLLDASASVRPWKHVTVYLNGRNLLDSTYLVARRPFGARPGAPRWGQAGVRLEF